MERPVLVVMAAGMGSRYGGLKQLDPVGGHGQLILDYSIYAARRAGFQTVVFVIKEADRAAFQAGIGDRLSQAMEVRYAYQRLEDLPEGYAVPEGRAKPWGTCHAVLAAREAVDGPFAVINADDYYGPEAFREIYGFLSAAQEPPEDCAMVAYLLGNTLTEHGHVSRGLCQETPDHFLTRVTEHTHIEKDGDGARSARDGGAAWEPLPADALVSMNLWGFPRRFLEEAWGRVPAFLDQALAQDPLKGEYFLPSVVSALIQEGKARVKVLRSRDRWYGVTYREDKPGVVRALAELTAAGLYPEDLWGAAPVRA